MNDVREGDGNNVQRQIVTLTVTQLNNYVKGILDSSQVLNAFCLKGEISNFTNHYKTGHFYFSLKDEGGVIRAVMFRSSAAKLKFMPADGMKIIAHGRLSLFVKEGQCMFYADSMEPDGVGALYIAFEQLKKKLTDEGLVTRTKKPLPKYPKRIGVITSPTGAAIRDVHNILGRRFPYAEVVLFPALVQGEGAAASLIEGMRVFNSITAVDVIIIGRGGGSMEDLWAFNDEQLARAVAASRVPVISAVGHETDFTICDFVADVRAPTPSAAAELAVPETSDTLRRFGNLSARLRTLTDRRLQICRQQLMRFSSSPALCQPQRIIGEKSLILMNLEQRLESSAKTRIGNSRALLGMKAGKLEALNPLSVIARGYSAVFTEDRRLLRSVDDVEIGDRVHLRTMDGEVVGEIREKKKYGNQ